MPTINYKNAEGKRLSGVTTIISSNLGWNKRPLQYWYTEQGQKYPDLPTYEAMTKGLNAAADCGTISHAMMDRHLHGLEFDAGDFPLATEDMFTKAKTGFNNYLEWRSMVNLRPIATEVNLVSEVYQFGGTPDCVGQVIDDLAIVDWKTSNSGPHEDWFMQLAAYRVLWEENNPTQPITGGFHLLRVNKENASFTHYHWQSLDDAWVVFLHLLELHKLQKVLKKLK